MNFNQEYAGQYAEESLRYVLQKFRSNSVYDFDTRLKRATKNPSQPST